MSRTAIILWIQSGCPACHEFRPTFNRISSKYRGQFPIYVIDVNTRTHQDLADRCGINSTPTTCALRQPTGLIKLEGAVGAQELERLFQAAYTHR